MQGTNGRFIVVEGLDGAGKTTLIEGLQKALTALDVPTVTTRGIGGTVFGQDLRDVLLNGSSGGLVSKECQTLLLMAASRDMIDKIVAPSIAAGKWVLCDRFRHSTLIYQQGVEQLETLLKIGSKGIYADLTIFLDVDFETSQRRLAQRDDLNHFDTAKAEVFNKRRERMKYLISTTYPVEAFMVIDATQDANVVLQQAMDYIRVFVEDSNTSQ